MILNCPNCSTRYLLSSAAIGEEGRTVRCAKCSHEWFQDADMEHSAGYEALSPEEDHTDFTAREDVMDDEDGYATTSEEELRDDMDSDFSASSGETESIPESVKPLPRLGGSGDKDNLPKPPAESLRARLVGYGAAWMVFICVIAAGMVFKQKIATAWPPATAIYKMVGMPVSFKGEDLVMESLSATIIQNESGQEVLVLKGRVINLTDAPIDVPNLMAVLRSTNGEDGDRWIIEPPVDVVEPGASFAFTSDYPNVPRGVGSVNLVFVPIVIGANEIRLSEIQG